jgi:hypothetical protein
MERSSVVKINKQSITNLYKFGKWYNFAKTVFCFMYFFNKELYFKGHTLVYSIIPFLALLTINILVALRAIKSTNSVYPNQNRIKDRRRKLNVITIILTFFFMITTMPSALVTGFLYNGLIEKPRDIIIYICDTLTFSFHSIKLVLLVLFNNKFRQEFRQVCLNLVKKGQSIVKDTLNSKSLSDESWCFIFSIFLFLLIF